MSAEPCQHFSLQTYKICCFLVLPSPKRRLLLLPPSDVRMGRAWRARVRPMSRAT